MRTVGNSISHQPRHVLITGATGFIGSNLVRVLLEHGLSVRVLIEPGVATQNLNGLDVEHVQGDLRDPEALIGAVRGCDTVYHLGAIFDYWLSVPAEMYRVNVEGTVYLLRAARAAGVQRFVHCSSVAALGTLPDEELATEETTFNNWDNADDYVLSKYIAQQEALRFNGEGIEVVVGMPCFPMGRNDITPTPTGTMFQQYIEGKNPTAFIGGINLVNVRDVAKGLALCGTHGRPGQSYTLGGHNITYKELGERLCEAAGQKRPARMLDPNSLLWVGRLMDWFSALTKIKPKFTRRNLTYLGGRFIYFDTTKVETELGYQITPLDETIEECLRWFTDERDRVLAGDVVHPAVTKARPQPTAEASVHAE